MSGRSASRPIACLNCKITDVVPHCPSATCGWVRCRVCGYISGWLPGPKGSMVPRAIPGKT